jgi:hypothetical protein
LPQKCGLRWHEGFTPKPEGCSADKTVTEVAGGVKRGRGGIAVAQMVKKINIASKNHGRGILLVSNEMTSISTFGWESGPNRTTLIATPCVHTGVGGWVVAVKVMLGQLYWSGWVEYGYVWLRLCLCVCVCVCVCVREREREWRVRKTVLWNWDSYMRWLNKLNMPKGACTGRKATDVQQGTVACKLIIIVWITAEREQHNR